MNVTKPDVILLAILEKNAQKEGQNPPPSPTSGAPQTSALPDLLHNAHDTVDKYV